MNCKLRVRTYEGVSIVGDPALAESKQKEFEQQGYVVLSDGPCSDDKWFVEMCRNEEIETNDT